MISPLPEAVRRSGARTERVLDVRPVLERGGDPFTLIMRSARELADDEALHLVVGFEPAPLYTVMRGMGRAAHTEESGGAYHVWFYRAGATEPERPAAGGAPAKLLPPVEMDVRGLEPPQPMVQILQKLVDLGPGAQLLVRHHREPVLLYDKLALRGYAARCTKRDDGDYIIHIAPAAVFQGS
ncbi:MAG TPA: DUF2249 domain-containing protein [Polyangia bacterium]|nr:DUF2249 domain-containing protein [Polyangia bacterium]